MQNNDFHCFEWLCIVFVWFAWLCTPLHCFFMICMVFTPVHDISIFLFFIEKIMQILCATLTIVFFLSTITPTLKLHIWVQTWPGLTCGDLRGPAGTCGDRSRPAGIGAHFGQNLIWIFTFVPTPTSILVSCAFAPKVWNQHSHNKKKTDFRFNVMNTTLFHLARYFLWTITVQHFKTVNCNDKHFCFFNPQKKIKNDNILWFLEAF